MNYITLTFGALALLMVIFMIATTFGSSITSYFHLIDKRSLLSAESWEKINVLMASGDFSMYARPGFDGVKRYNRLYLSYSRAKNEDVSKSFENQDINKMVDEAFAWAQKEGYLETPHEKQN